MADVALEMDYSVETSASLSTAWNFWTNVANWDDPPAEFELNGPFVAGARGRTRMPGQPPIQWIIREVHPPEAATIEIALDGATLSFEWRFDQLSSKRTRLTQRVILRGTNAGQFVAQVKAAFTANLAEGMAKVAEAIAKYVVSDGTAD